MGADKENLLNNQVASLAVDHFLYSHDLNVWYRGDIKEKLLVDASHS